MIDVFYYIESLTLTWLRRTVMARNNTCYGFVKNIINFEKNYNYGKLYVNEVVKQIKNNFWKDILYAYSKLIDNIPTMQGFSEMPLFYNHNFLIGNKGIFIKSWNDTGIRYVKDILKENGTFLDKHELERKTGLTINFLTYLGVKNAVKKYFNKLPFKDDSLSIEYIFPIIPIYLKHILKDSRGVRHIYSLFIRNTEKPSCNEKWCNIF